MLAVAQISVADRIVSFDAKLTAEKVQPECDYERFRAYTNFAPDPDYTTSDPGDCVASLELSERDELRRGHATHLFVGSRRGTVRVIQDPWRNRGGIVLTANLTSRGGAVSTTLDLVAIEKPRTIEALTITTNASPSFDTADFRVFDDNTNELLWEWDKSVEEPGLFALSFVGEEQFNRAFRFEYEVDGTIDQGTATYAAFATFVIPEPDSNVLAAFWLLPIAAFRKRGRRRG